MQQEVLLVIGHLDMIMKADIVPDLPAIMKPGCRVNIDMSRHGVAEVLAGGVVLAVALGFMVYAVAHSGRSTGTGYTLQARFEHIDGLSVGGDVRIAGVKVGTVTEERIDPKSFSAIVSMTIRNEMQLPKDTAAEINSESLLGGKYISLSPGGDDTILKPGQTITITQSSVSLEQLLGKFIFSVTSLNSSKDSGQSSSADQKNGSSNLLTPSK